MLGKVSNADRVYYFLNRIGGDGSRLSDRVVQWEKHKSKKLKEEIWPRTINFDEKLDWYEQLRRGEIITGYPADLELRHAKDIKAVLIMPLMHDDQFIGFIGFDNCSNENIWDDTEISLLKIALTSLALTEEHDQAEEKFKGKSSSPNTNAGSASRHFNYG